MIGWYTKAVLTVIACALPVLRRRRVTQPFHIKSNSPILAGAVGLL